MAEYIEREEAIRELERKKEFLIGEEYVRIADAFIIFLKTRPAADVAPVVRCKDCKYHHWEQEPCHGRTVHYCDIGSMADVTRDSFCSYGVRKDGGGSDG